MKSLDSEIGDPERDAETEGPEFSSGSIQHDIFQDLVQHDILCVFSIVTEPQSRSPAPVRPSHPGGRLYSGGGGTLLSIRLPRPPRRTRKDKLDGCEKE